MNLFPICFLPQPRLLSESVLSVPSSPPSPDGSENNVIFTETVLIVITVSGVVAVFIFIFIVRECTPDKLRGTTNLLKGMVGAINNNNNKEDETSYKERPSKLKKDKSGKKEKKEKEEEGDSSDEGDLEKRKTHSKTNNEKKSYKNEKKSDKNVKHPKAELKYKASNSRKKVEDEKKMNETDNGKMSEREKRKERLKDIMKSIPSIQL